MDKSAVPPNIIRIAVDERDDRTTTHRACAHDHPGIFRRRSCNAQHDETRHDRGRTVSVEIQGSDDAVRAVTAALAASGALAPLPPVQALRTGPDSGALLRGGIVTDPAEIAAIEARVNGQGQR